MVGGLGRIFSHLETTVRYHRTPVRMAIAVDPVLRDPCVVAEMRQIHMDYQSPVEEKGQHSHSLKRRAP